MKGLFLTDAINRYRALKTNKIISLLIVILMPHSRCVMCDIWKGNDTVQQLKESDIEKLLISSEALKTRLVVISGGEALMHPNFFILAAKFVNFITKEVRGNLCFTLTQKKAKEL